MIASGFELSGQSFKQIVRHSDRNVRLYAVIHVAQIVQVRFESLRYGLMSEAYAENGFFFGIPFEECRKDAGFGWYSGSR